MPNDDGLKEFLGTHILDDMLSPGTADEVRGYLTELLSAREEIAIIRRALMIYVDRNIELSQEAKDAKKTLEHWVTQAGMWEAKARGNEEQRNG